MVIDSSKHTRKTPVRQGSPAESSPPSKINAHTPFDFAGKNLTPYGGLFPVATMLEKLKFQQLIEETLTVKRIPRAMGMYQFILSMVLAIYVGFSRLNHIRFVAKDPMLTRILKVLELPGQSTFWRFLASLHLVVAGQLLQVQRVMRERVWAAAQVRLNAITLDTDTTVHTLYGKQIARHLERVFVALPQCIQKIFARADSGFYCWEAVQAYEKGKAHFIIVARKTSRLLERLQSADWKPSPKTDADEQCEFWYQPEGWAKPYRFIALRYKKKEKSDKQREQYQLFDCPGYLYRVFVTDMDRPIDLLVWFYNQRAGAENLIKEANNDAGLAAHPSGRWAPNCVHFQLVMLAYNLNCWLMLFHREEGGKVEEMKHTTLATARLRFLFLAAKFWKHNGQVGISYSDQYQEKGLFQRLMERLRGIAAGPGTFLPVLAIPLEC